MSGVRRRRGITLIEFLVVLSIIGILMALIVPAVQDARESARRAGCGLNLKQIGLGLQQYEGTFGSLPPGRMMTYDPRFAGTNPPCSSKIVDKSLLVMILPFLEQSALYNAINEDLTILGRENRTAQSVAVAVFACPSDPASGVVRTADSAQMVQYGLADPGEALTMVATSYSGVAGTSLVKAIPQPSNRCVVAGPLMAQEDGVFHDLSPIRFASIGDGLGQTLFVVEKATTNFRLLDQTVYNRAGCYTLGNFGDTLATTFFPPNMISRVGLAAGKNHTFAASSLHPGGLNALMGDGSVRFVKDTIQTWPFDPLTGIPVGASLTPGGWWQGLPSPGVWQKLSTRAGGEVVSGEAY